MSKPDKSKLLQLTHELSVIQKALYAVKDARDTELQAARDAVNAKYKDQIELLEAQRYNANYAVDAEQVHVRLQDTGWFPVGTKVKREERVANSWYRGAKSTEPTYQYGLVEVFSVDSARPDGNRWCPSKGEVIVRLLKKDGSQSKKYEAVGGWSRDQWVQV